MNPETLKRIEAIAALPGDIERRIVALNCVYAEYLDEGRLEEWPDLFVEDGVYRVWPRENRDAGMQLSWINCHGKAMLRDRAMCVADVNIYNLHYPRHFISNAVVTPERDGAYGMRSNYLIVHTDNEGHSRLFSTGQYLDTVILTERGPLFREKLVIVDTFTVTSHVSVPL